MLSGSAVQKAAEKTLQPDTEKHTNGVWGLDK